MIESLGEKKTKKINRDKRNSANKLITAEANLTSRLTYDCNSPVILLLIEVHSYTAQFA